VIRLRTRTREKCEQAIISDKEQFGRISTIRMRYLREKYGHMIADRALPRIQKRGQSIEFEKRING